MKRLQMVSKLEDGNGGELRRSYSRRITAVREALGAARAGRPMRPLHIGKVVRYEVGQEKLLEGMDGIRAGRIRRAINAIASGSEFGFASGSGIDRVLHTESGDRIVFRHDIEGIRIVDLKPVA